MKDQRESQKTYDRWNKGHLKCSKEKNNLVVKCIKDNASARETYRKWFSLTEDQEIEMKTAVIPAFYSPV